MGTEKFEKKLPEEIISIIDSEAANLSITRQEVISRLIHKSAEIKHGSENERLKIEIKDLIRQNAMKDDEISYLRGELSILNLGLSKLAENLVKNNVEKNEIQSLISPLKQEITSCSDEIKRIQTIPESRVRPPYEEYTPLIIVGILAGLLIVYLIVMKLYG